MKPDKVDLTVKRKKGDVGVKEETIKEEKPACKLKKQKIEVYEKPVMDISECKKQKSVICFTGMSNGQQNPLLTEDEIKIEEEPVILTALERKQNMQRENQKRILMYNQQHGIERYSKMTTKMRESSLNSPHENKYRFGVNEAQKCSPRELATPKMEEEPIRQWHNTTLPEPSNSPLSSYPAYPTPSPQSSLSLYPTPPPQPTPSPPHPIHSDLYSNPSPPHPNPSPPYLMHKPYLSNPTPPYDNASPHYPTAISPLSNVYPRKYPPQSSVDCFDSMPSPYSESQPVSIPTPHSTSSTYLTTPSPRHSPNSPPIHSDIMGIVNITPLLQPKQYTFDNFLSAYSFKYGTKSINDNAMQIDDEEDSFNFCPEEKTWVPIKKRNRMTKYMANYDVFPEKRHLDGRIVPVMAFTFEESRKISVMLQAQAKLISTESSYAMKCINPDVINFEEKTRVEAVAKGAKVVINEDYLQFRHKLSKEIFVTTSSMFFDDFTKLPRHVRDILFESTFPSTIGLWFAYLHSRRGAENLQQQESGLLCSQETENFRTKNIPEIVNTRSIKLEDFEIMTSPWAVNEEDEIKFEKTIKTVGDIIGGDFQLSVLYLQMVLCNPHPGSILCRSIHDHPALQAVQMEINNLMYRYLKSKVKDANTVEDIEGSGQGYNEDMAAKSLRSLQYLVNQLHECAHIFWKKRIRTDFHTQQSTDICIDELMLHVWDKPLYTMS